LRQAENYRQQEYHAEEENHPRSVFALAEAAEESNGVRGGSDGKEHGRGPAEQQGDRAREERADPAEISLYVAVAEELSVTLGSECAGEEEPEKQEDDPPNLARERGLGRLIVRVPARAS
jgi:hypothetical protein